MENGKEKARKAAVEFPPIVFMANFALESA